MKALLAILTITLRTAGTGSAPAARSETIPLPHFLASLTNPSHSPHTPHAAHFSSLLTKLSSVMRTLILVPFCTKRGTFTVRPFDSLAGFSDPSFATRVCRREGGESVGVEGGVELVGRGR